MENAFSYIRLVCSISGSLGSWPASGDGRLFSLSASGAARL
jgi:hypothetical protein